jgi:hypothetical protein
MRAATSADRDHAAQAIAVATPAIERAMRERKFGDSGFLHVVVMRPGSGPADGGFEECILYEHSFGGERAKWDADYAAYARAKAEESWRTRRDNPRGAVWLDGVVVGASGAFEPIDRAYAATVASWIRAIATQEGAA